MKLSYSHDLFYAVVDGLALFLANVQVNFQVVATVSV